MPEAITFHWDLRRGETLKILLNLSTISSLVAGTLFSEKFAVCRQLCACVGVCGDAAFVVCFFFLSRINNMLGICQVKFAVNNSI